MRRTLLKSKIHRAVLTGADLHYEGSIQIDTDLMAAADLVPFERVQVLNVASGARLETYVIEGEPGAGEVCLNGPAARLGCVGDLVIIASYADYEASEIVDHVPTIVLVDEKNRPAGPRLSSGNVR
jgi:aspartate 1-decarboxylase